MGRASLVAALLLCLTLARAQCPWQETGLENWSNAATWSGGVPAAGSAVTIPAGKKVLLDVSPPQLASITVLGQLIFRDTNINLNLNWLKVDGGRLAVGSAACAISSKIIITLFGARSTANDIGPDLGTKGIVVLNGGSAEFFGAVSGPSWTRLAVTAAKGSNQLVLAEAVTWPLTSQIFISSTDFIGADYAPEQAETFTITDRSADGKTLTLSGPLQYMHWGLAPEAAEVGLLTRQIVIQGDASSTASQFGGHLMFYYQAMSAKLRGVEFTRMGQQGVLGRYPIHYHMMQNQVGAGHIIQDCSIHDNLQRCVTIHNTNGVLIKDNVAFRTLGHCYFIEDGAEELNVFDHNVASNAVSVPTNPVIPSDTRAACFWITNPNNTYINNAAGSCHFGFWFAFPMHPNGKSLQLYAADLRLWPRFLPILRFDSNVAHSALDSGFFVDQMPDANGVVAQQEYNPVQGPYTAGTESPWSYPAVDVYFSNCIAYKCREHGIWTRGSHHVWYNAKMLDNHIGFDSPGGPSILRDSVIVAESDNIGNPVSPNWLPDYNGRSRPVTWSNEQPIIGWETYDASGPDYVHNVEFVNFVSNNLRKAGAIGLLPNAKNIMLSDFASAKLRYTNSPARYWWPNYPIAEELDTPKCSLVTDADGTGTGNPQGAYVHTKGPFLDHGPACTYNADFNVHICPPFREGYINFELQNQNVGATDFAGTNAGTSNLIRASIIPLGDTAMASKLDIVGSPFDQATRDSYRAIAIMRRGYTIRFLNNHPTPPSLRFWADAGMAFGDWIVIAIPYPSSAQPFTVVTGWGNTPCTPAASLAELSASTYFYDTASQHLYLRVEKQSHNTELFDGRFATNPGNGQYTTVTASCSGSACRATNFNIPPALPKTEDVFQANLQPCQAGTTATSQGTAFFSWNPRSLLLSYSIYHSLHGAVTAMHVHSGAVGQAGGVEFNLMQSGQGGNPIRGAQRLTRDQYLKLIQGSLYVMVHTAANPGGEIRGQIGCVGTCTPPAPISTQDPCTPSGSNVIVYQDVIQGWPNWRVDQWGGATAVGTNADAPKLCAASTAQVKVAYTGNGAVQFGHSAAQTIAQTHIQFYARTTYSEPFVLQLVLKRSDADEGVRLDVTANYMDNYAITGTWTRVRIPLSAFGASNVVQYIVFAQPYTDTPISKDLYVDEFRFITPGNEPMTAPISAGSIVAYNAAICSSPTAQPAAAVNTATSTAATTTVAAAAAASTASVAAAATAAAASTSAASTSASVAGASTAAAASTASVAAASTAAAASTSAASTSAGVAAASTAAAASTSTAAASSAASAAAASVSVTSANAAAATSNAATTQAASTQATTVVAASGTSAAATTAAASATTAAATTTGAASTSAVASTSAATVAAASTAASFAATSTSALSAAATSAAATAAASNGAAASVASTSTAADAASLSTSVAASTTSTAATQASTTSASTSAVAASLASVSGTSSTASFAASTTSAAASTAIVSTAVEAALSTSVASSTAAVSTAVTSSASSTASTAVTSATSAASSTATSDSAVAATTGAASSTAATSATASTATAATTSAAPGDVPDYVIALITNYCMDFGALAARLAVALGVDASRFVIMSYEGCAKRQSQLNFYVSGDADGSVARAAVAYLNSASDPAIVSASVKSASDKSASSKHLPLNVIVIVGAAIAVSLIVLLVLVVVLSVRRHRMQHRPHYTGHLNSAPAADTVLLGLYSNTGSNRANNPLLADDHYAQYQGYA